MTPSVLVLTVISGILMLTLPKKYVPIPFFLAACYITLGQTIKVGPFNFTVIRILVIFSIARAIFRGEIREYVPVFLDKLQWVLTIFLIITGTFLEGFAGLVNRLGLAWDMLGVYFTIRLFVSNEEEIVGMLKAIGIIMVPIAIFMVIEKYTGRNIFSFFGGVAEFSFIRDGKLRCQGAFQHPILAGTAGAISVLQVMYFFGIKKNYILAYIILAAGLLIIYTSNSSGPIMTLGFGFIAMSFWPLRMHMKKVKWVLLGFLIIVQLSMKAPIWWLMARIDLTGSSTGWFRAQLISSAFEHFNEWWLIGTTYTRHWMPTGVSWSERHTDIVNNYLEYGVIGGVSTMLLFIATIGVGFRYIGNYLLMHRDGNVSSQVLAWVFGAILFAHSMTFLSVHYFDQTKVFFYSLLGMIGTLETIRFQSSLCNARNSLPQT
jgi:hypothetical protein